MSESDEVKLVERLRVSHDRVSEFPEVRGMAGIMDLLALRNIVPEAADTIERLVAERDDLRGIDEARQKLFSEAMARAETAEAENESIKTQYDAYREASNETIDALTAKLKVLQARLDGMDVDIQKHVSESERVRKLEDQVRRLKDMLGATGDLR